ncbi:diphthamide biosynthesis protein 2 [Microthyrium microscopicum]|uniref:2-(3-amino-3-carboxypropyl)histidine synthase subunit 2 n=1 Tax=Microthyrium microscopicum TaxID=703497 RepID=A0A6A6UGU6_9PEZI|nr:diphthamide biosynthesis protein 2 [Microthyrium microscopicum]
MAEINIHPIAPPVLSTPETHIFEEPSAPTYQTAREPLSKEEIHAVYEIQRTLNEIQEGKWRRIALQFEDSMLPDAGRVYDILKAKLSQTTPNSQEDQPNQPSQPDLENLSIQEQGQDTLQELSLFVLGDTSYGACCVDEIAAEHVDAQVVVHYGRACLSPTARLPVIYVYTTKPLDSETVVQTFKDTYAGREQKVIIVSDLPYYSHQDTITMKLEHEGYQNVFATKVLHNPSSPIPNRTIPEEADLNGNILKEYDIFHIGEPPAALLLTLSSRVYSIHIYTPSTSTPNRAALRASTAIALRKRYALITSLSAVGIYGILINTLSVANYLPMVEHVKAQISAAGKKHYTFVVGKVNAAKIANFAEIGGWVVIGCWESSLVESSDFYRPLITPFELRLALLSDEERTWTGAWSSDFNDVLRTAVPGATDTSNASTIAAARANDTTNATDITSQSSIEDEDPEESAPPEFDLRTGRYISHSRPMRAPPAQSAQGNTPNEGDEPGSNSLVARRPGEIVQIGGTASPGAEFLRAQRTWQGLGSDFATDFTTGSGGGAGEDEGAVVEEGRRGVARGYADGMDERRR